jgi:hypothetical protein
MTMPERKRKQKETCPQTNKQTNVLLSLTAIAGRKRKWK